MAFFHLKTITRLSMVVGYVMIILAGIVIFRTQLFSISNTEYTYFIDRLDAGYAADYWNKLPSGAQVLDRIPERSVTIFGRITRAYSDIYEPLPDWEALIADPDPKMIADAGYAYVYMDNTWWDSLTTEQQAIFQQPCIDIIEERKQNESGNYRLLVNVSACRD
jgi:hypothetical protein